MTQHQTTPRQTIILAGIFLSVVLVLFVTLLFNPLLKLTDTNDSTIFFFSRLFYWICLIFIFIYSIKVEKQKLLIWTEKKYSIPHILILIIVTILIMIAGLVILILISKLFHYTGDQKSREIVQILHHNKLLLVFTSLTAGITEELICRGYILTRLQLFFKKAYMPIIISSLFFGIAHISYDSIPKIIGAFFIGLVFGYHYQKYRNIKILIVIHFIWDLTLLLIRTNY